MVKGVLELFRERNLAAGNERVLALEVDAVLVVLRAAETHVLIRVRLRVGLTHTLEVTDIGTLAVRLKVRERNTQRRVIHRGDRERGIVRRGAARRTVIETAERVIRPTLEREVLPLITGGHERDHALFAGLLHRLIGAVGKIRDTVRAAEGHVDDIGLELHRIFDRGDDVAIIRAS